MRRLRGASATTRSDMRTAAADGAGMAGTGVAGVDSAEMGAEGVGAALAPEACAGTDPVDRPSGATPLEGPSCVSPPRSTSRASVAFGMRSWSGASMPARNDSNCGVQVT